MRLRGDEAVHIARWRRLPGGEPASLALAAKKVFDCQTDFTIHLWQRFLINREVRPEDLTPILISTQRRTKQEP